MFIILEGIRNLIRAKLAAFMVILVIGAALLVGGWFFIITVKLHDTSGFFESAMEIDAFLYDTLSTDLIASLKSEIEHNPGVIAANFISKDSAAIIFYEETGEDIHSLTGENPLPPSFRIQLKADLLTPEKLDSVMADISTYTGIEDIVARREFLFSLLRYRRMILISHITTGVLIIIFAFLLISNATKLSIMSRKKSIEVMKLVGATNRFIKGPFLIEGFIEGLAGGILSGFLIWGFVVLFQTTTGVILPIGFNVTYYMIGAGCFLGVIGSNYAVHRFLNTP